MEGEGFTFEGERNLPPTDLNSLIMIQVNRIMGLGGSKERALEAYYDAIDDLESLLFYYQNEEYKEEIENIKRFVELKHKEFKNIDNSQLKAKLQSNAMKAASRMKFNALMQLCADKGFFPRGDLEVVI